VFHLWRKGGKYHGWMGVAQRIEAQQEVMFNDSRFVEGYVIVSITNVFLSASLRIH